MTKEHLGYLITRTSGQVVSESLLPVSHLPRPPYPTAPHIPLPLLLPCVSVCLTFAVR